MFGLFGAIIGILMILVGGYMFFFMPITIEHQEGFGMSAVIIGLILMIAGFVLVFIP